LILFRNAGRTGDGDFEIAAFLEVVVVRDEVSALLADAVAMPQRVNTMPRTTTLTGDMRLLSRAQCSRRSPKAAFATEELVG